MLAVTASMLLTSCFTDDNIVDPEMQASPKINLSGEITQIYQTRANQTGFCDGDEVGIQGVDYNGSVAGELLDEGNRGDNVRHTFDEANFKWNGAYDLYFKDSKTNVDIYGYYPFASPDNVSAYAFEVKKDQSTSAAYGKIGGYEASDFLWGKTENVAPTDKVIKLGFRHMMASARVTLAEGEGFDDGEWTSLEKAVLLLNTKRESTINLATGEVTAIGDVPSTGTIPYVDGSDYRAIIVPQSVGANTPLISITVGGTPYVLKKSEEFTYIPSKQHNFTITVNKRVGSGYEFVLSSESITAWENDAVSHDATAREYIVINVEEAGMLKELLESSNNDVTKVKNLKITGSINVNDFYFMRDEMSALQSLNLKEVKIEKGDDPYHYKEDYIPVFAFQDKRTLMRLVLPDKLVGIEPYAFYLCKNLTGSLIIPEGVIEIGDNAFGACQSMTGTLQLPTTLEKIDNYGFNGCGFACELVLPDKLAYIGDGAFSGCENLYGSLKLPDKLTHLGEQAFRDCLSMSGSIEIPKSLTTISPHT